MLGYARQLIFVVPLFVSFACEIARAEQPPGPSSEQLARIEAIIKANVDPQTYARIHKQINGSTKQTQKKIALNQAETPPPLLQKALGSPPTPSQATNPPSPPPSQTPPIKFLVRNDWSDLGILGACGVTNSSAQNGDSASGNVSPGSDANANSKPAPGVSTSSAKGATGSLTQDYVAHNTSWVAQGMAAAVFSNCSNLANLAPGRNAGLAETSLAIYAQTNSNFNSNPTVASKNNVDTNTVGVSGEAVYQTTAALNIFRLTPNVVQDEIKNTTAVAVMAQYVPALISVPGIWVPHAVNGNLIYQFDPTLDVQYASTTSRKNPILFSGMSESLRIGPELALIVSPFSHGQDDPLSRLSINELFHPWYETYSNRANYWWTNTIKYNLDAKGNFAISASYNRGQDENSGATMNQYVLSLNGKI
jgi:hypothetical protein